MVKIDMQDLISKQMAMDALEQGFKDVTKGIDKLSPTYRLTKAVTGIYKCYIGKLSPVQPESHWIPCSERLPEEDKDVLCKTLGGVMFVASYGKLHRWTDEKGWIITPSLERAGINLVDWWMPLPEFYKEVEE